MRHVDWVSSQDCDYYNQLFEDFAHSATLFGDQLSDQKGGTYPVVVWVGVTTKQKIG